MRNFVRSARMAYFGNATVTRDYRTQLRGNRSLWLWLGYLGFMVIFGGLAYSSQVDTGYNNTVSTLQQNLSQFYGVLMGMISGVVCLVAPGLTAAAVTTERQRRSLDLLFSAPVSPRYFLVGKMISGFRYLLMLLILSLPIISVCVVMGGATWSDVIGAVIIILNSGIVMMAIGLLCSAICPNSISAILASYVAIFGYYIVTGPVAASSLGVTSMSGATGPSNWMVTLIPFTATYSAPTYSLFWGHQVPNWILLTIYSLVFAKFALVAAGSALSPSGSAETKSLRIHGLLGIAALSLLLGSSIAGLASTFTSVNRMVIGGSAVPASPSNYGSYVAGLFLCTFLLWPQICAYGNDGSRRFFDDGHFNIKAAITGTPGGALPYMLMLILSAFLGMSLVVPFNQMVDPQALQTIFWAAGFGTLWWGLSRFISARTSTVKAARIGFVAVMLLVVGLPLPVLAMIAENYRYQNVDVEKVWRVHLLAPLFQSTSELRLGLGLGELVVGILFAWLGVRHVKKRMSGVKFDV